MSCCGQKRKSFSPTITLVMWTGQGTRKVLGNITGVIYEFPGTGHIIGIDTRDTDHILAIPGMSRPKP